MDNIVQGKTRIRREFCSFYTESDAILSYMVNRLDLKNGDVVLEPCAGDGVFIKKIIESSDHDFSLDVYELNPKSVQNLKNTFEDPRISIKLSDTLIDLELRFFANLGGKYNKIIGNPPYGAWQDYDKRNLLKKIYKDYSKETYTLFLHRCIDLLVKNGRLVFIIPDTFLSLNLHKGIRKKILTETQVEEILLIPSKFFPGVKFGYSNLCIISLRKSNSQKEKIRIVNVKSDINILFEITKGNYQNVDSYEEIHQSEIINSMNHSFLIGSGNKLRELINNAEFILDDIAYCVTGFYSGDNRKYLFAKNKYVRGSRNYRVVDESMIDYQYLSKDTILDGLQNHNKFIPILKGGNSNFKKDTEWFVLWDRESVQHYKRDSKARYQNSKYYFKQGIGMPMVKSNRIKAFLLDQRLFDQSIVGIFPKDEKHLYFLLALLNSEVCNRMLKVINHTANNSANYVKKLPIILNENAIKDIDKIISEFFENGEKDVSLSKINDIFDELYQI